MRPAPFGLCRKCGLLRLAGARKPASASRGSPLIHLIGDRLGQLQGQQAGQFPGKSAPRSRWDFGSQGSSPTSPLSARPSPGVPCGRNIRSDDLKVLGSRSRNSPRIYAGVGGLQPSGMRAAENFFIALQRWKPPGLKARCNLTHRAGRTEVQPPRAKARGYSLS